MKPREEHAEYLVTANRSAFFGKSADILWLLHLAKMYNILLRLSKKFKSQSSLLINSPVPDSSSTSKKSHI